MVRLSLSGRTEPYWARRARYRFDDPSDLALGARFGVLYAAPELSTAFCESVIHESSMFRGGVFEVSRIELERRERVSFSQPTGRELQLVDLTAQALKRLGLNNDISAGDDYELPQLWSKAIHDSVPAADGLRYVSRQRNGSICYAIFERSGLVVGAWRRLTVGELEEMCAEFNVVPV